MPIRGCERKDGRLSALFRVAFSAGHSRRGESVAAMTGKTELATGQPNVSRDQSGDASAAYFLNSFPI